MLDDASGVVVVDDMIYHFSSMRVCLAQCHCAVSRSVAILSGDYVHESQWA